MIWLIVIGTAIWVGVDAHTLMKDLTPAERVSVSSFCTSPTIWAIGCLLLWIIAFPWYLAIRKNYIRLNAAKDAPIKNS